MNIDVTTERKRSLPARPPPSTPLACRPASEPRHDHSIDLFREEAARIVGLSAAERSIELLSSGRLQAVERGGTVGVEAAQLEAFLRDALLNLYRAEASAPAAASEESEPVITHTLAEFETPKKTSDSSPNLRVAPRYKPKRPIAGKLATTPLTILQLSTSGLRVRHDETFRPGQTATLTFSVGAASVSIKAQVIWTSDRPDAAMGRRTALAG